jgi:CheY-like chemotaxis protein
VAFTAAGGRVELSVETRDREALVRVADTGEGMDPAFLPLAFERFRQGDSATTRAHHGLGLGLYIARHLTELHGGRIAAESPGRGRGSTFTISLPLAVPAGVAESAPGPAGPEELPPGLRVLVVDDDDDARDALRLILKLGGAEVETAASVAEAIEAIHRRPPEVVLSDIAMPGEDGLSLIRRVRALAADDGIAVRAVALTACASAAERDAALHAGFDRHVAKPVDPPELLRVVASLAGRRAG